MLFKHPGAQQVVTADAVQEPLRLVDPTTRARHVVLDVAGDVDLDGGQLHDQLVVVRGLGDPQRLLGAVVGVLRVVHVDVQHHQPIQRLGDQRPVADLTRLRGHLPGGVERPVVATRVL